MCAEDLLLQSAPCRHAHRLVRANRCAQGSSKPQATSVKRMLSRRGESNSRQPLYERGALPTELLRRVWYQIDTMSCQTANSERSSAIESVRTNSDIRRA